MLQNSYSCTVV